MFFSDYTDSHDKYVRRIRDSGEGTPEQELREAPAVTNYNLVGIRRRLNNIEIGIWVIVVLEIIRLWRS